jgi:L-cysteine desulfidase
MAVADFELVRFQLDGRESVVVEVDDQYQGAARVSAHDRLLRAERLFEENLEPIRDATEKVLNTLRDTARPDEIKLISGIKLTAEAGAVIAKSGLEGNIGVEMVWKRAAPGARP